MTLRFPGFFFIWLFFRFSSLLVAGLVVAVGANKPEIPVDTAVATSHIIPAAATCEHCAKSLLEEAI